MNENLNLVEILKGSIDDEMSNCLRKGFASVIGNIYDNPEILEGGEK